MDSHQISDAIAELKWIDTIAKPWQKIVGNIYERTGEPGRKVEDFLHGKFLGHPLHAVLVHLPVGAWTLAAIFDLFSVYPAAMVAADWCVVIGLIGAVPAAITGSTDYYMYGDTSIRRIGGLHAILNVLAIVLYLFSAILRFDGSRGFALFLSLVGFMSLAASGYIGGLLVYEKRIGTNHSPETEDEAAPSEFVAVMPVTQLQDSKPAKVRIGDLNVVLVRLGAEVFAMADACAHMGGPMSEGEVKDRCLVCPWHQSAFRLFDGQCVSGPSVFAQATFPVRIENGQILVKAVRPNVVVDEFPTPHGHITVL